MQLLNENNTIHSTLPETNPKPQPGHVISLEGVCGVGKTHFCKFLNENFGSHLSSEMRSKHANSLGLMNGQLQKSSALSMMISHGVNIYLETPCPIALEAFYANPKEQAFTFQAMQQAKCLETFLIGSHMAKTTGALSILDRSFLGNWCFEDLQYQSGYMSEEQHRYYQTLNAAFVTHNRYPNLIVLLDANINECVTRLDYRRTKTNESIPDTDYLRKLYSTHDKIIGYGDQQEINYSPEGSFVAKIPKIVLTIDKDVKPGETSTRNSVNLLRAIISKLDTIR